MNQGMLILLLSLLSGGTGNTYGKGAGGGRALKIGADSIRPVTTRRMIRQMHEAIDALQRVEQISRLADFSTIRKKEKEGFEPEGGRHDHKDSYIGNIREAFGNIGDLLGGAGDDEKRDGAEEIHKQAEPQAAGNAASGTGMNPEALISLLGNLMGNMNANNSGNVNGSNGNPGINSNGNGFDIDKLMKMVSLISSLKR